MSELNLKLICPCEFVVEAKTAVILKSVYVPTIDEKVTVFVELPLIVVDCILSYVTGIMHL